MGKKDEINKLTNIMSVALRHNIGSIVNKHELYAAKYAKDSEMLLKQAETVARRQNWNQEQKEIIRNKLKIKLKKELEEKDFIDEKKFDIMGEEMEKILIRFRLL